MVNIRCKIALVGCGRSLADISEYFVGYFAVETCVFCHLSYAVARQEASLLSRLLYETLQRLFAGSLRSYILLTTKEVSV
jgi:hypothetical protein